MQITNIEYLTQRMTTFFVLFIKNVLRVNVERYRISDGITGGFVLCLNLQNGVYNKDIVILPGEFMESMSASPSCPVSSGPLSGCGYSVYLGLLLPDFPRRNTEYFASK